MPPKKDPYSSPAQKVLALYGLLLFTGRKHSLPQLAELLQCSKQTVLRLVEQIELTHTVTIHSWTEEGRKWFQAKSPSRTPNVALTVEQIQHLLLCRDMVLHLLPRALQDEIGKTIAQTSVLLPEYDRRDAVQPGQVESRPKGLIDYSKHQEALETILKAIRERRVCQVKYHAPQKTTAKEYSIGPLKLITHQDALYVTAQLIPRAGNKAYPDPLLFALHRFKQITLTDTSFVPSKEALVSQPHTFGFVNEKPFRARIRFSPAVADYITERIWSQDQRITRQKDGGIVLELSATSDKELIAWALSLGCQCEVLAPEDIRREIATVALRVHHSHSEDT